MNLLIITLFLYGIGAYKYHLYQHKNLMITLFLYGIGASNPRDFSRK